MKIRFHSILLASLLLFTITYAPVIYKVIAKASPTGIVNDYGEEAPEKSSSEVNHETEQEEDSFNAVELLVLYPHTVVISESERFPFGLPGHYPEIVSPPPQIYL